MAYGPAEYLLCMSDPSSHCFPKANIPASSAGARPQDRKVMCPHPSSDAGSGSIRIVHSISIFLVG